MFRTKTLLALGFALALGVGSASADIRLSVGNNAVGGFPRPYGSVYVSLTGQTATITFNAGSSGGFNYLFIDSSSVDVNVNSSSFTEAFVSATGPSTGGFSPPTPANNPFGSGNVDGFGNWLMGPNLCPAS
jgi:hypothetical protein